jgi:tetratricopeptide (TPR) repeat protein
MDTALMNEEANMKRNALRAIAPAIFIVVITAHSLLPQAGRGTGRINGVVVDSSGNPVEGAAVVIYFAENQQLKREAVTNKKGEWAFMGLGTGIWHLRATAKSFLPTDMDLSVKQLERNPKITVTLQRPEKQAGIIQDEAAFELLEKGNQLFKEEKYDEAIALYEQFFMKNPAAYQVQLNMADAYREKGDFARAVELYNIVLELAKTDTTLGKEMTAKSLAGIGNCYLKQNRLLEAQDFFKKSIESSPNDEILAYNVGEIYFSNQSLDEALRYFGIASEIKPSWPDPFLKMGYVYLNKADNAKALENFEKFIKLEPDSERASSVKTIMEMLKKK